MNSLGEDFFSQLAEIDVMKNALGNVGNIVSSNRNSFTFVSQYQMRQESKAHYQSGKDFPSKAPTGPIIVSSLVKVIFEPNPGNTHINQLDRFKLGLSMARQTCNRDSHGNYVEMNDDGTDFIGFYPPFDIPFRRGIQKFYEQTIELLEFNVSGQNQTWMVTILVAEGFDNTLAVPVNNVFPSASKDDLIQVILGLANIGESLSGKKILSGDISLENIGIKLYNGKYGTILKPILPLSDVMVEMEQYQKDSQYYVDPILRYSSEYRAPWVEDSATKQVNTVLYQYTPDLKEDGYALWKSILNFISMNQLSKNLHVVRILIAFNKEFPEFETEAGAPTPEQVYDVVLTSLRNSKFIKNRLLI